MPFQQMLTQLAQQRQGQGPAKGQANAAAKSGKAPGTPRSAPKPQRAPMQAKPPMATGSSMLQGQPGASPSTLQRAPTQGVGGILGRLSAQPPQALPPTMGGVGSVLQGVAGPQQGGGIMQLLQLLAQKRQQAPQPNQNGGSSGEATVELPNSQF